MANVAVTLTAYNMGPDATEADFDNWAAFVAERIDAACGFECEIDQAGFVGGPSRDVVADATDEQEETVREALRSIWDDWCASGTQTA